MLTIFWLYTYLRSGHIFLDNLSKYSVALALGPKEVLKVSADWFAKIESARTTAKLNMAPMGPNFRDSSISSLHPTSVVTSANDIFMMLP